MTTPARASAGTAREQRPVVQVWRRRRSLPPLVGASLVLLALAIAVAAFAPEIAPFDPREQDLANRLVRPGALGGAPEHPLGTDHLGRDVLTRLLYGMRTTLGVALVGTLLGMVVGCTVGLVAGVAGGWVDDALMFLVDVQASLPFVLVALTAIALIGSSLLVLVLVVGLAGWEVYARVVRSQVLMLKEMPYLEAARALGATGRRIALSYLLPGVSSAIIVMATVNFTQVMLLESALSFLGVGIQPPGTSLGAMLGASRDYLLTDWTLPAAPAALIVLLSMAVSAVGDWLSEGRDPRH